MENFDFLKKRAKGFYESGREQIKKQRFFLAAFSFEQAAQLYLKHCLFIMLKDFPKIHELNQLFRETGKVCKKEREFELFLKDNASVIGDLNQAYITSRYLPVEFNLYQVEEMAKFVKKLINFLKKYAPKLD